jgi:hypothetical protein
MAGKDQTDGDSHDQYSLKDYYRHAHGRHAGRNLCGHQGQAQAGSHHKFGVGLGIGFAAGVLAGVSASGTFAGPVYVERDCRYVRRYNRWGEPRLIKVCDYY